MELNLDGKTCLITGASAGIGAAIARVMAQEGVKLAILARRRELLESLACEIQKTSKQSPIVVQADLMDPESPEQVKNELTASLGRLDILVNNAGQSTKSDPISSDVEWNRGFEYPTHPYTRYVTAICICVTPFVHTAILQQQNIKIRTI